MKLVSKVFLIVMAVAVIACGGGGGSTSTGTGSTAGGTGGGTPHKFAGNWSGTFSLERFNSGVKIGSTETGNAQLAVANNGQTTFTVYRKTVTDFLEGPIQSNDQMTTGATYSYYLSGTPPSATYQYFSQTSSLFRISSGKLIIDFSGWLGGVDPTKTFSIQLTLDKQP